MSEKSIARGVAMNGSQESPMLEGVPIVNHIILTGKNGSLGNKPRRGKYYKCDICGKDVYKKPFHVGKSEKTFCSYKCHAKGQKTQVLQTCCVCGLSFSRHLSTIKWQKKRGNINVYCSKKCYGKNIIGKFVGDKSPNWEGGKNRTYKTGYHSAEYKEWRMGVFERDNFICQYCGQVGGILNAHHIFGFSNFPEFKYKIYNGITLCEKCHDTTKDGSHKARLICFSNELEKVGG
jgi:hypothetical protein